jgi:hypothetical protein
MDASEISDRRFVSCLFVNVRTLKLVARLNEIERQASRDAWNGFEEAMTVPLAEAVLKVINQGKSQARGKALEEIVAAVLEDGEVERSPILSAGRGDGGIDVTGKYTKVVKHVEHDDGVERKVENDHGVEHDGDSVERSRRSSLHSVNVAVQCKCGPSHGKKIQEILRGLVGTAVLHRRKNIEPKLLGNPETHWILCTTLDATPILQRDDGSQEVDAYDPDTDANFSLGRTLGSCGYVTN